MNDARGDQFVQIWEALLQELPEAPATQKHLHEAQHQLVVVVRSSQVVSTKRVALRDELRERLLAPSAFVLQSGELHAHLFGAVRKYCAIWRTGGQTRN